MAAGVVKRSPISSMINRFQHPHCRFLGLRRQRQADTGVVSQDPSGAYPQHTCMNLNSYQYDIVHRRELLHSSNTRANYGNIHCYKKAIEDGKLNQAD
jgi:hypothetical protein